MFLSFPAQDHLRFCTQGYPTVFNGWCRWWIWRITGCTRRPGRTRKIRAVARFRLVRPARCGGFRSIWVLPGFRTSRCDLDQTGAIILHDRDFFQTSW